MQGDIVTEYDCTFYSDIGVQIVIIQAESSEIDEGTLSGPSDGGGRNDGVE
jgi:hypothetical protein